MPSEQDTLARMERIRDLVAALPVDTFGEGTAPMTAPDGQADLMRWPVRDEIVDDLTKCISALREAEQDRERALVTLEAFAKDSACDDWGETGIDNPVPVTHAPGATCPVCSARELLAARTTNAARAAEEG